MKIRAVLPPFLPLEEIGRRVASLLPDLEIVTNPTAPGRYPLDEVEVLVLTTFHDLPASLVSQMAQLRFVQVASTGYDRVDLAACRERGIWVSNVPVANAKSVAEHVLLLVLATLRDLRALDGDLRRGEWPMLTGTNDLAGKVFGIVGMGRIGRELAARLVPFEVSAVYADIVPLPPEEERRLGVSRVAWPDILDRADIVSLHLPLTPETRGIMGAREFARLKDQAIFVNTARSELVDLAALRDAVTAGRIRAALDVFPAEPPDFTDPVFRAPNTVLTPHIAGVTFEAQQRFLQETIKNVLRYVEGKAPLYRVDGPPPG